MYRKILGISLTFLVIAALIIGYFIVRRQTGSSIKSINAIPVDAALICESSDLRALMYKLTRENEIWKELKTWEIISRLNQQILFLDSIIQTNSVISRNIQNNPVLISIHTIGKEKYDNIFYLGLDKPGDVKQISDLIEQLIGPKGNISEKKYENEKVWEVSFDEDQDIRNFSYTFCRGIFMFSYSSILLGNAIRQVKLENSLQDDPGFLKVLETSGKNVEANIYINYKYFPKLLSHFADNKYSELTRSFVNYADWAELDVTIKNDIFLLNGFSYSNDSANNYVNIFFNQSPVRSELANVLPGNTSAFLALGINDFSTFYNDYSRHLTISGGINEHNQQIYQIEAESGVNIIDLFDHIFEKEICIVITDIKNVSIEENTFVVVRTKGKSQTENELLQLLNNYARKENQSLSSYIYTYNIDEETSFPIYRMPLLYLTKNIFGNLFSGSENRYFCFYDNYLIFGNSVTALSKYIHSNVLQTTLQANLKYTEFSEYLFSRSNFSFYVNISRAPSLLSNYLNDNLKSGIEKNINSVRKLQAFVFQFSSENNMAYNNLVLKYDPDFIGETLTEWESLMDTSIAFKPQFMTNHNTNEKEIFIQDLNNNIYLVNISGRILWKMNIPEKIKSEIFQIDYYKNQKLQILFSTQNYIHLIDRNGNYVERYPVKLRSPATNGISLFDYDNNKNYRIFVATENKKVYAYSKEGNILPGWEFDKTDHIVNSSVQHFQIGGRDYIVFADKLRPYILDRRGRVRINPEQHFPKSKNNNFILEPRTESSEARLVTTDTSGVLYYIYFTGKVEKKQINTYTPDHFFDYQDVDGDKRKDLIMVDKNRLEVISQNESKIFSYDFGHTISLRPIYFEFSQTDLKIGIVSTLTNEIYLFNNDGNIYEGFPLPGNTLFSIGHFPGTGNKFNLIVGNYDKFLYNYSVQ